MMTNIVFPSYTSVYEYFFRSELIQIYYYKYWPTDFLVDHYNSVSITKKVISPPVSYISSRQY